MSETVHYKGQVVEIKPTYDKTLEEIAEFLCKENGIPMDDYTKKWENGSWLFQLCDSLYERYVSFNGRLFEITHKKEKDLYDEIIEANHTDIGYAFELKFYNGGASFGECLREAIEKCDKK